MGDLRDRFAGCLLGGAVGDALGAPYEGLWADAIPPEDELLRGFAELEGYPRGQFTDDTQLALASIEAIVETGGIDPAAIARAIAELWRHDAVIGPGGACTRAALAFLRTGDWTACGAPEGQAGNGTAMRMAAIGLFFVRDASRLAEDAAAISRITHHDARSVAGGVAVAKAAQLLATMEQLPLRSEAICNAIGGAMEPIERDFANLVRDLPARLAEEPAVAIPKIACSGASRPEFERPIITPFVIPTVLAALWAVLRQSDSWSAAVAAAIRLGGDVDTLGAIVGSLMGARLGAAAIPAHLAETVVDAHRVRALAARYHALVMCSA